MLHQRMACMVQRHHATTKVEAAAMALALALAGLARWTAVGAAVGAAATVQPVVAEAAHGGDQSSRA